MALNYHCNCILPSSHDQTPPRARLRVVVCAEFEPPTPTKWVGYVYVGGGEGQTPGIWDVEMCIWYPRSGGTFIEATGRGYQEVEGGSSRAVVSSLYSLYRSNNLCSSIKSNRENALVDTKANRERHTIRVKQTNIQSKEKTRIAIVVS